MNNAPIIRVTSGGTPAGLYEVTLYCFTRSGAMQLQPGLTVEVSLDDVKRMAAALAPLEALCAACTSDIGGLWAYGSEDADRMAHDE